MICGKRRIEQAKDGTDTGGRGERGGMKNRGGRCVRAAVEVIVRNGCDVRHEIQSRYLSVFVVLGVTGRVVQPGQLRVRTTVPGCRDRFSGSGGVTLDW